MLHFLIRSIGYKFITPIILAFILTSCQPSSTRSIPTAEVFYIHYSPSLSYMRESFASCISSIHTIAPYLIEQFPDTTTLQSKDIIFSLGETDWKESGYFVTQIGYENIVFIINELNSESISTITMLQDVFSGSKGKWFSSINTEEPISIWVYPDKSSLMKWLENNFIKGRNLLLELNIAPHPQAVLEAVSNDPDSIGFIPSSLLNYTDPQIVDNIKVINLIDVEQEEMSLPILAYLAKKPEGGMRDLLLCLQEEYK